MVKRGDGTTGRERSLILAMRLARRLTATIAAGWIGMLLATTNLALGGEYRFHAGSRTIARASAEEPVEDPSVHPLAEPTELQFGEFGDDPCWSDAGCFDPYERDYWMELDYLLWWRKGIGLPPMVTTSSQGTAFTDAGVLGLPPTTLLYGNSDVGDTSRPGGRFSMGAWCDPCRIWSVGGRFAFLGSSDSHFQLSSADTTTLGRPFLNVTDNQVIQQDALVVAFPGVRTGTVIVDTTSEVIAGDAYLRRLISDNGRLRVELQYGYQFSRIAESLTVRSETNALDLAAELRVFDQFQTRNEFHGATLGLAYTVDDAWWSCRALVKVGLGNMHQSARLSGEQIIDDGVNAPVVSDTGLLVQSTNRGLFSRNTFAAVPELNLTGVFHLTPSIDLSLGYTYIYWNQVLQPGNTIDPSLAVNLAVPPIVQRPARVLEDGGYWVHGLNLGVVWRY
ncbi:MAG: hypothetical protein FJ295_03990 [Planctomycetes bacterium]|nr:hypothetical protein [Planctomycetota bacterium]